MTRMALSPIFKNAHRLFTDLVLPPSCFSCHEPVADQGTLCPRCWSKIEFITPPLCDKLGIPLPFDTGEGTLSAAAIAHPPAYNRARAVAAYSGIFPELIHDLKYRDHFDGLPQFARWLAVAGRELLVDADYLIPVPLYWSRLWSRRFNQSAELARALSKITDVPYGATILYRVKRTKTQVGMTPRQRKQNVSGAFLVHPPMRPAIEGKNLVLIDDVITTGATIEACVKTLLAAGAGRVNVLALARVTDRAPITI